MYILHVITFILHYISDQMIVKRISVTLLRRISVTLLRISVSFVCLDNNLYNKIYNYITYM